MPSAKAVHYQLFARVWRGAGYGGEEEEEREERAWCLAPRYISKRRVEQRRGGRWRPAPHAALIFQISRRCTFSAQYLLVIAVSISQRAWRAVKRA